MINPGTLAPHYSRFRVAERLLLTGHSHQAWPDRGFDGQMRAWLDAAELVDDKWERAFAKAERVAHGFTSLLDDTTGTITLGVSTHDLVIRFLSALPLRERPRIVTTDGEFHTLRRQLDRLAEERIEIVKVSRLPAATVGERLAASTNTRTAAVMVSAVFYEDAQIAGALGEAMKACQRVGAELLVDAYHALNAIPFSIQREGLTRAFVVGGGYKYCQLGEGNCFLRVPEGCTMRPVITGWFSEFGALAEGERGRGVPYGAGGARFAGATYDPTSHYRAAEVFDFFAEQQLTPPLLRDLNQHQVRRLAAGFDALDPDPAVISRDRGILMTGLGAFLALRAPKAAEICKLLRKRNVFSDYRGETLRLGPAPYVSDAQLDQAIAMFGEVVRSMR